MAECESRLGYQHQQRCKGYPLLLQSCSNILVSCETLKELSLISSRGGECKVTLESIKCVKLLQYGKLQLKPTRTRRGACRKQYKDKKIRFVISGDPHSLVFA